MGLQALLVPPVCGDDSELGSTIVQCGAGSSLAREMSKSPDLGDRFADDPLERVDGKIAEVCEDSLRDMDAAIEHIDAWIAEKGDELTERQVNRLRHVQDRIVDEQRSIAGCLEAVDPGNAYLSEAKSANLRDGGSRAHDWAWRIDHVAAGTPQGMYGEIGDRLSGAEGTARDCRASVNRVEREHAHRGIAKGSVEPASSVLSEGHDGGTAASILADMETVVADGHLALAETCFGFGEGADDRLEHRGFDLPL